MKKLFRSLTTVFTATALAITLAAASVTHGASISPEKSNVPVGSNTASSKPFPETLKEGLDARLAKMPAINVKQYGADGTGRNATISRWADATHVVVADASIFKQGQEICIPRAAGRETTGDVIGTSITVGDASIFKVGDYIKVVGGFQPKRQVRTITIKVAGNAGDKFYAKINDVLYTYTALKGDTTAVASGLARLIDAGKGISAIFKDETVTITADVAGTPFTYENIRPTGRGKVTYATLQPNVALGDFTTTIKAIDANMLTVSNAAPDRVSGVRIEHDQSRLNSTIAAINGNTLTLTGAALNQVTGVIVYHNDQPAFTAARAAADATNGYVYAPAGTYYLTENYRTMDMKQVSLIGDGKGRTVIRGIAKNSDLMVWSNPSGPVENIVIRGVTLDGCDVPNSGNDSYIAKVGTWQNSFYSTNILVDDIEVLNSAKVGLAIYNPRNAWVRNSRFSNVFTGLHFGQYDSSSLQAPGNIDSYNIWVMNNSFEKIAWIGGLTYANGTFPNINNGDYITGTFRNVHVRFNTFKDCYLVGWEFYTSTYDSDLIGNRASYCGAHSTFGDYNQHGGLSVKYSSNIVVADNHASNCRNGIEVFGYPETPAYGLGPAKNIMIYGNRVFDNFKGIDYWGDTDGAEIHDNIIEGADDAGASIGSDDEQNHVKLTNIKFWDNQVKNGRWGLYISPKVDGIDIRGNIFENNNSWEENCDSCTAIALIGSSKYSINNVVISDNKMVEKRVSPAFKQTAPIYAKYAIAEAYANNAAGNTFDTPILGINGILNASLYNSWDQEKK